MTTPADAASRHCDYRSDVPLSTWWRFGARLSAQAAKAAAGRAHRVVSEAALQVCGAIALTAEHDPTRYTARGFQVDALCESQLQLEALLDERLFAMHPPTRPLPALVACS
ncbi:hypothetical protein AAHS21_21600 [Mycobacterium sp. 050272]|uniref:hypothetical protein n=1 Tax=Mycobacterium TaxID=1763 RepID=UPI0008FD885A